MALSPIPGPAFRSRTFSNVQPFTYEDGLTVAETISRWLAWFRENVMPVLNEGIPGEIDRLEALIADLQAQVDSNDVDIIEVNVRVDELESLVQSIIDNSIEAQDPVVAAIVRDPVSETRAELDELYVGKDSLVYNAADHGVVGSGSSDDTATMQALIDSVPDGSTIVAPAGSVYRSGGWNVENRDIVLDLSSAELVQTTEEPILRARGNYSANVSAAVTGSSMRTTTLSVSNATQFSLGDIVKVISDDVIWDARPAPDGRFSYQGQHAVVTGKSGGDIDVVPPLIDDYSTNVRMLKIDLSPHVDLKFKSARSEMPQSGWGNALFRFHVLAGSRIEGHISSAPGTAFADVSSVYTRADIDADGLTPGYGYGVLCSSSQWGEYRVTGNRGRHLFTDGTSWRDSEVADPEAHGRPMWAKVTGSSAGSAAVPLDTHHGGYGHVFHDFIVTGAGAPNAVQLRGRYHTLDGVHIDGFRAGVSVFTEKNEPWATSYGHTLIGCSTKNTLQPFSVSPVNYDHSEDRLILDGGRYEMTNAISVTNSVVRLNDPVFVVNGEVSSESLISVTSGQLFGSATLTSSRDVQPGPDPTYIVKGGGGGTVNIDLDLKINFNDALNMGTDFIVSFGAMVGQVRAHIFGDHRMGMYTNESAAPARQSVIVRVTGGEANSRNTAWQAFAITENNYVLAHRSGDDVMAIRVTSPEARTVGKIQPGSHPGQRLNVYCSPLSPAAVTITDDPANAFTRLGGDRVLNPGDSLSLVWDLSLTNWVALNG